MGGGHQIIRGPTLQREEQILQRDRGDYSGNGRILQRGGRRLQREGANYSGRACRLHRNGRGLHREGRRLQRDGQPDYSGNVANYSGNVANCSDNCQGTSARVAIQLGLIDVWVLALRIRCPLGCCRNRRLASYRAVLTAATRIFN